MASLKGTPVCTYYEDQLSAAHSESACALSDSIIEKIHDLTMGAISIEQLWLTNEVNGSEISFTIGDSETQYDRIVTFNTTVTDDTTIKGHLTVPATDNSIGFRGGFEFDDKMCRDYRKMMITGQVVDVYYELKNSDTQALNDDYDPLVIRREPAGGEM